MKAISLDKVGGSYSLIDDVPVPVPGEGEILVKSLVTALNPVEEFQRGGFLVDSYPVVLGCDASGTVVSVGEGVTKFKKGDGIFGCPTLGKAGFGTFQEFHLIQEKLAFKRPANVTVEQAATIGVGILTAGLGLKIGLKVELKAKKVDENSEWIVILGAAGAVGQFAIQIGKLNGYKILAACSPSNNELVKSIGADATFNYKQTQEEQIAEIKKITGGNFARIFDASSYAGDIGVAALAQNKSQNKKYFSTTNDWAPPESKGGVEIYLVRLGEIGKSGSAETEEYNKDLKGLIVDIEPLLESGELKPLDYVQVGDTGVGEILKAIEIFKTHKSGKKVVVRLAEE